MGPAGSRSELFPIRRRAAWRDSYQLLIAAPAPNTSLDGASQKLYCFRVIKSFRCKDTQALFEGRAPRRFKAIATVAERKLQMLDAAKALEDLRSPPGNRLEALKGNRQGQWSIRVNNQWRVCFRFKDGEALDVEIVDYH
jgi:proteic killer suppression protein